ncbi:MULTISPECIES: sodium:solute symporter family protein [unclassified Cobetia]|uniref:sodium:solute symporter family protein n=1 Tax=unclassified Cobetia TaxID=2609414 RepID=UPI0012992C1F|nr:sodium:solute symporter family protein [Cobetia sp. AM6]UTV87951.1 sodium:solute symporter family protein [Cobetia litoralis]BBO56122.1 sodium:proline symporter [Cobetia sp. AM6]
MAWYYSYIIGYFVIMFAIGYYYFRKVKTSDSYLIAGWNMGYWKITGTTISTWCGAAAFIGWMGMGFSKGLSGYFMFALPGIIASLMLVIFFSRPLRRKKLYTLADLFGRRFGRKASLFPSFFSAFVYSVPATAIQIIGMSTILTVVLGLEFNTAIFVSFALILGFTILGGLEAAIVTDALQSILLIAGIMVLGFTALSYAGGLEHALLNTPIEFLAPLPEGKTMEVVTFALTVAPFYLVWQCTWQRIFASESEDVAIKAGVSGFSIVMLISFLPYCIGVLARQFVPLDTSADLVFSYVTMQLLHPAIGGLVIVGLLAALMTSADSYILQGSSNLAHDLYGNFINRHANEKQKMASARLSVVIISVLGLGVTFLMTDIISAYQWALRISATTLIFPFFAVMFWKHATSRGCISSMASALSVTALWPLLSTGIDPAYPGFLTSLVVLVVVSKLTRHSPSEDVAAYYWDGAESHAASALPDAAKPDIALASKAV